ncbi:supervillin isoform X5 [Neocloeon triangulifer]|uniref:supervillin isoform X5 n=1 Tax=Neocloeon triangulifer TaxID=2078957 RepID=UPI00286F16A6|nr:supervillin isoform X5 [Neocloeon triangulifer]
MYLMQTVSHAAAPRKVVPVMDQTPDTAKKPKSKWTLGSLFRRRASTKHQQEASASSSEDEKKPQQRSFLSHRRSNKKRSDRKAEKSAKIKIEQQPWSGSANSLAGSSEGFGSHSSLTRRDRRELVKARVEATRRDSSSDENDFTLRQSSSLTRFKSDESLSSLNRRTRAARTERYKKRLEKSSEPTNLHHSGSATWNATVVSYRETSPFVRAVSATPSPLVSPKMSHRPLPPQMMSPPRVRRSYCCEAPPFMPPRSTATPQMYATSAFIPFSPKQAPPPPPRDPLRKFMGTPQQYVNVEAKPVYRSRSDHQLPQGDHLNAKIFPSSSQTHFKYLADRTPRSRRPIHVIPVHEQSPECILPTPPTWLNEPPTPAKKSTSPPIRRVSSIEVTLRTPTKTPPPPPVRRYSRQGSVSSVEDEVLKAPAKVASSSTNLEEALNELEEIYQSLQLGDEDLLDRAERRDLPTAFQLRRGASSDVPDDMVILRSSARAPPLRRSGVPDLVNDDMAFRRLNNPTTGPPSKDRTSGSYLLVSPALSPIPVQTFDPEEPNTTFDDMSYRAIKDANLFSSKVLDPQPPFGIPLAPAPPASNNDYLHVKPTDKYRPTFRPRKTPDVVSDDLAFRNLRKDNNKMGDLKQKRAVRSLSANLMNLMEQREEIEKTQSLGNLPETLQVLFEGTEMRTSPGSRPPPSWIERAHLMDTSTETLTQSRANLRSLRNSFLTSEAESRPLSLFMPANQISPIKEVVSSVPNSASTEYSEPFDEEKLEELLSALAQEAQDTSERLGKELERLRDGSHSVEDLTKSPTLFQGHRSPSIRNVFQVAEPCVEAMNSQIKARERIRLASINSNGSPKIDKANSTSPSSSGLENVDKSPTKRIQRKTSEIVAPIRTTRTSRLRAAAANASSPSSESALSDSKPVVARTRSITTKKLQVDYPDSSSSSREGTPFSKSVISKPDERDKSAKRKSSLNRGHATEKTGPLSSGESTTDESSSSRLRNRMAPSPRSAATCRTLRNTTNPPSLNQNHKAINDLQKVASQSKKREDKAELSKRVDSLLAKAKEGDARLDKLEARKANKNRAAPPNRKIVHSATKENEKNAEKARAKDHEEDKTLDDEAPKKILAPNNLSEKSSSTNSAFKAVSGNERKTSILKKKSVDESSGPISILKHEIPVVQSVPTKAPSSKPQSILKKKSSLEEQSCEDRSGEELDDEPQSILKRNTSSKSKMHTILKKKSSEELLPDEFVEPRPILKKRPSTEDEMLSSNEADKPRPILKSGRRSAEGDESNYSSATSSPVRRSPSVNVEEGVIRNQVNLTLRFNQPEHEPTPIPAESACLSASEDENSRPRPSVSERAQLFMRLQEMHKYPSNDTPTALRATDDLPATITTRRERARRFSTQPVTSEEVDEAKSQISNPPEPSVSIPTPVSPTGDSDEDEDEPSSLTLAERVRLFTQKIEQQRRQPKEDQVVQKRTVRRQVTSTRFRTLPVTDAEVEVFSNTLGSHTQPPGLDDLVAKAVRESTPSEASDVDQRPKGILKHGYSFGSSSYPPSIEVPTQPSEDTDIVRGILKIPASVIANALGSQQQPSQSSAFKSALKKDSSSEEKCNLSPARSILKSGKPEEWTESSSEEEINSGEIRENLASILNDVATQAKEEKSLLSSDTECDTSSSGGREIKNIISSAIEYRDTVATLTATAAAVHQQQGVAPEQEPKQRASSAEEASSWAPQPPSESPKVVKKFEAVIKAAENGHTKKETICVTSATKMSIAERLALLKQSGETEWKKRVPRASPVEERASNGNNDTNNYKPLQQSKSMPGSTRGILAEKLNQLDEASSDWKKRVAPKDAGDFSVAGRMGVDGATASPFMSPAREKRTPKPARFKSKKDRNNRTSSKESDGGDSSTPESPVKEVTLTLKPPALARSVSAPDAQPVVKVPSMTDHLDQFFTSTAESITIEAEDLQIETLPDAQQHTLLVSHRKTVQVQKRRNATRNPLKTLAARTDIVQEYQEFRTGAAEREIKRLNVEKLAKNSNLAVEALAGLASKEDFTAVNLKKASGEPVGTLLPFRDLMLLQVKGRRHVQTRLVEPVASKVNQGDSFVLVTPTAVYNWLGKFSNIIERTRSAEIALQISQRKDLGCLKAAGNVFTIDEAKNLGSQTHKKAFWKLIGVEDGIGEAMKAGHPDEDEEYENLISETNKIWTVEGDELIPVDKYWGSIPKIEVLDPNKVVIFDFGSELYIWNGKNATVDVRKFAAEFVQDDLWDSIDYSDCDISPVGDLSAKLRPEWAILGKLSQHMETALFREKFLDWPEFSRIIKVKSKGGTEVDGSIEILPCDAKEMAREEWREPDFELEGSHIGRGEHYFDSETRRHFEIATTAVEVWHVDEFEYHEVPEVSFGQFHEGDSYVVRWSYSITVSGRELSGAPSKHGTVGRNRCAYFFWQGSQSSLNEQGAAALLTVELDKEEGPQVRVVQGSELAVFRGLFNGHMAIHQGRRQEQEPAKWRLFVTLTGAVDKETCLLEVAPSVRQLRSRSSLLLVEISSSKVLVWHGNQSHKKMRAAAINAAKDIHKRPEFGLKKEALIEEIEEGEEHSEFFKGLGGNNTNLYHSLPNAECPPELKLFHFSSASGAFTVQQLLSQTRTKEPCEAFPFVQRDLYELSQPALVLVDAGVTLWLWQGWWPQEDGGDDCTGSGAIRWQAERRAAMQTAVNYWQATRGDAPLNANLVWAGLESFEFTNLFPDWKNHDDATESNMKDGRKPGETLSVEEELARLTQSTYPPAQLLQRPLPDGVDPTKLEEYLAPEHFEELLGMSKEDFCELPTWKQTNLKKQVGLF